MKRHVNSTFTTPNTLKTSTEPVLPMLLFSKSFPTTRNSISSKVRLTVLIIYNAILVLLRQGRVPPQAGPVLYEPLLLMGSSSRISPRQEIGISTRMWLASLAGQHPKSTEGETSMVWSQWKDNPMYFLGNFTRPFPKTDRQKGNTSKIKSE